MNKYLLQQYPGLKVIADAAELEVVPIKSGFEVRCGGQNMINITGDIENGLLMREQNRTFIKMEMESDNFISRTVKVVRKVNVLLNTCEWRSIKYIWTPCGFLYEVYDAESNCLFCIKLDPKIAQKFIVVDKDNTKKYEIMQVNNDLKITSIRDAIADLTPTNKLTDKLLLVCVSVLINKRTSKRRIFCCNCDQTDAMPSICSCNCSLRIQTIVIFIVLCLLILICIVSFSSWVW